jgi:hypothetical protein
VLRIEGDEVYPRHTASKLAVNGRRVHVINRRSGWRRDWLRGDDSLPRPSERIPSGRYPGVSVWVPTQGTRCDWHFGRQCQARRAQAKMVWHVKKYPLRLCGSVLVLFNEPQRRYIARVHSLGWFKLCDIEKGSMKHGAPLVGEKICHSLI